MDEKKDAISTDYSGSICASCHSQYNDFVVGPHNSSLEDAPMDMCLSCHSTQGFLGQEVTLETEGLDSISCVVCHTPHSATNDFQLREETQTETCGACHTGTLHHPQYDLFTEGPHEKAGLDCTSCHGQGEALIRGSVTEHFNHTFAIYDTYYPYNQTDPLVCTKCHDQTWATTQLGIIQGTTEEVIANVTKAIHEADTAIATASQTSGVDQTKITEAVELFEEAEHWVEYVENDKSSGLHNPEATFELLSEAWRLAGKANSLAINAQQEATSGQLTSVQEDLSNVQEDLSNVQGNLNSTQTYMYVGAIGGIIGGLILGLLVGRRWTTA
jgi:predicted CXXCH cytochrome family protein